MFAGRPVFLLTYAPRSWCDMLRHACKELLLSSRAIWRFLYSSVCWDSGPLQFQEAPIFPFPKLLGQRARLGQWPAYHQASCHAKPSQHLQGRSFAEIEACDSKSDFVVRASFLGRIGLVIRTECVNYYCFLPRIADCGLGF